MAEAPFPFLRATFYRWMQVRPAVCPDLARAPRLPGVGDLHVENFGTWRDVEGRLVWGVNDFDEAAVLPFTVDLVRLATSALLAAVAGHLTLKPKEAWAAILDGYRKSCPPSDSTPAESGSHRENVPLRRWRTHSSSNSS